MGVDKSSARWLPEGMWFLSGLPLRERRRRLLVPFQAFCDESGGIGDSPVLVLCGLIGRAENWADFSERWTRVLDGYPSVKQFKMHQAAKLKGQFAGWSIKQRDRFVQELLRPINDSSLTLIYCWYDLSAYSETIGEYATNRMANPYFLAFHSMILWVCEELKNQNISERFEIIFDENRIFGQRAKEWYPLVQWMNEDRPEQLILPVDPLFRSDEEFVPLQAADLFAWLIRREMSDMSHSFAWITEELPALSISQYCQEYNRERMQNMVEEMKKEMERIHQQGGWEDLRSLEMLRKSFWERHG